MRSWIIERWLEDAAVTRVPVTVCPCGCTWKDPSGASAALMALAVNCRHPRQRALQGGGAFCPDCNHWQFTQAELAASKVRMPRPMYRVVEEDERVG